MEEEFAKRADPITALNGPITLHALLLQHTEERLKLEAGNKAFNVKAAKLDRQECTDDLFGTPPHGKAPLTLPPTFIQL